MIATLAVFGSIVPQGEEPAFYQQLYGPLRANFILLFHLNDVYHSWWFYTLVFLLIVSLLACSLKRLTPLRRQTAAFQYLYEEEAYSDAPIKGQACSNMSAADTAAGLCRHCQERRYRVFLTEKQDRFYCYADRGRFGPFGSLVTHLSLVLIVIGALYGGLTGFKSYANIPLGESFAIRQTGFAIKLNDFQIDYYDNYMPKQYYSDLQVIDGARQIMRKVISVNNPLTYQGVTFYQTSYGWVVDGVLTNRGKESKFSSFDRDTAQLGGDLSIRTIFYPDYYSSAAGHPENRSPLPQNPRVLYILYQGDQVLQYDLAELDKPVKVNDIITVTFNGYRNYTGLQIVKDPGIPIVYIGSVLMMLGLLLSFYVFPQRIWAMVTPAPEGCLVLITGTARRFPARLAEEIRKLEAKLQRGE
ncbi:MAG: cytochrome c biogenesis protein ResB [Firmicutes bacterium]|nr:cytochrome c biogenesis protein ResB [Bacillota bacterium]